MSCDRFNLSLPVLSSESAEAIARRLSRFYLQSIARSILPEINRISHCLRHLAVRKMSVEVWRAQCSSRAHYRGLQTCAQVWTCPVCAAKISERRRTDLTRGIEVWRARGGDVLMLVLTVPHFRGESVDQVLDHLSRPRRMMRNRKTYLRIAADMGLVGTVRALEATYGGNGWHVHTHDLLFVGPHCRQALDEFAERFTEMWESACIDSFVGVPNRQHGARLDGGERAGDYAAKWGLEQEMTKSHLKVGLSGNRTPWDLLRAINDGLSDEDYSSLYCEYAEAFKGRHQLEWSKGLRELLGLGGEVSDRELADSVEEEAEFLGALTRDQWAVVLRADRRGELLEVASASGWEGVVRFVWQLVGAGYGSAPF